ISSNLHVMDGSSFGAKGEVKKMSFSHILSVSLLSIFLFQFGNSGDILRSRDRWVSVKGGGTLVSARETFEAGFFRFAATEGWFLGIWYKNVPERTYVWVGNREEPLLSSDGNLEVYDGKLVIRDKSNAVWSLTRNERRKSSSTTVAQLLDNGKFVLKDPNNDNPEDFFSFEEPTDTILPEMKLVWHFRNKYLASWRAVDDPQPGDYEFKNAQYPVLSTWLKALPIYSSGPWNGTKFIGAPPLHYAWNQSRKKWDQQWSSFLEECDLYRRCTPNAYCHPGVSSSVCECIPGFEYSAINVISEECVRKKHGACNGDHFSLLPKMNFPDAYNARSYPAINKRNNAVAFALGIAVVLQTGNRNCITWSGDLVDIRSYSDEGQDLYVRTAAGHGKKKSKTGLIVGTCVCISHYFATARGKRSEGEKEKELPPLHQLGKRRRNRGSTICPNGFCDDTECHTQLLSRDRTRWIWGVLASGEEIAVKKLSEISKQGLDEFCTEVRSISRLRHINIARLYGWSVYKEEKLLIYEYLVNGSLERHLFGGGELNWQTRFHIIKGVAKGLAYIEEGGYNLILHRDLKPDNILLHRDMTPKISDFGLARMCARSEKEVFTQHTAGTHGYISPESLLDGIFSSASDVFSFGVIVLEIVNGKRNRSFSSSIGYLLGYETGVKSLMRRFRQDCVESWQVLRCIEVGLLCSQYFARDRPKISLVVAQLQEETIEIQKPKRPDFYPIDEGKSGIPSSSNLQGESSTLLPIQLPPTRFQT
ncbi:LOW QUALITY PROTEIN: hypothetical protein HID58_060439, partial [Brassica napus]